MARRRIPGGKTTHPRPVGGPPACLAGLHQEKPMPSADQIDDAIAESHLLLEQRIRQRAHQIYHGRGGQAGSELDDWLQAEREILGESPKDSAENRATVIGSAAS